MAATGRQVGTGRHWLLLAGATALIASVGTASAADLVSKGGSFKVPTYEGRVYYIKPIGASCPSGFNCFCNSGTQCTLPGSGTITGTVVIDRSDVTLDCQNRTIQPPRFGNSSQACTFDDCGWNPDTLSPHRCVNGFCQLANLGGVNVGGPLNVDDAPININVTATGFVQRVEVRNCVIRNFVLGYSVDGDTSDNGFETLFVRDNEIKSNKRGIKMFSVDGAVIGGNWVHGNADVGISLHYDYYVSSLFDTVEDELGDAVRLYKVATPDEPFAGYSRWLELVGSTYDGTVIGLNLAGLEGSGAEAPCNNNAARCDLKIESNHIYASALFGVFFQDGPGAPTFLFRNNIVEHESDLGHVIVAGTNAARKCWDKGNVCTLDGIPATCTQQSLFTSGTTCWY